MQRRTGRRIVAFAVPVVAIGTVALAGGFADASADLDMLAVGETHSTDRADITIHRAWVSNFRPDEPRKYTEPKRRLFVEIEVTNKGFQSEDVISGDGWYAGVAPVARIGTGEPVAFKSSTDAHSWEHRSSLHPGVPERLVLAAEWPAKEPVPGRVRLQLDDFRLDDTNLLIDRLWVHIPDRYVDVPLGPEPPPVNR